MSTHQAVAEPSAQATAQQFWNPRSGIFDGAQLRLAIVVRGSAVGEFSDGFACESSVSL